MVGETSAGKLVVEIVGDVAGLVKAYDEAKKQTEGFEGDLNTIGKSLTGIGKDLTLKVTAPLAVMGGMAFKTAVDFDDSMRRVQAVSGATGAEFDALQAKALELGENTQFSAMQAAEGMGALGQAGFDTNQILQTIPGLLDLAATDMRLGLGEAAEITTAALRGFRLEASESTHVADVLAQASSSSGADVMGLGEALKYAAPVASAASLSLEETVAIIAQLSDVGIKGSMAGTTLAAAISSLLKPTAAAETALAKYGLTVEDVNPESHTFAEIVQTLGDVGLESADALAIFGDRAGRGMLTLLQSGGKGIDDYTRQLEACDGAAAGMAETMEGGAGGAMREMISAVQTLQISFGKLIAEALMPLIGTVRDLAKWLSGLDDGTKQIIVTVGLFAAAIGPATWAVGTLAGSVGSMISLYRTYQASTIAATIATRGFTAAIMANPLGLAIIGVTTLGAVLLPLIASTNDATKAQEEYNAVLRETADLTGKTTETIEDEIDVLKEEEQEILANIEALKAQNVVVDRGTIATRQATQATGWHKLATGDLTREFRDTTDAIEDGTVALGKMTQAQKDAAIAAEQQRLAENRAAQAIRDTELQTRRLADGAKTAYEQASKAVTGHQREVTKLQKEYNALKETIDKALGIEKKIEDADRDIERADIRRIRAERDLADLQEEIKEAEAEARTGDADAKRRLADLLLDERSAVLDVAEAQDRYQDALKAASDAQQERVEIEEALNGESVSSAQKRLDEIGRMLEEEQEKLDVALENREQAQIAHENFMASLTRDSATYQSETWAEYVKFMDANPAYGRIYYVEHDENGNPIGGLPQPPVRDIQIPSYGSPAFAAASRSAASVAAGAAGGDDGVASAATGSESTSSRAKKDGKSSWNTSDYRDEDILKMVAAATAMVNVGGKQVESANAASAQAWLQRYAPTININQVIQVQKQSAMEVADATKRGLRDGALELGL